MSNTPAVIVIGFTRGPDFDYFPAAARGAVYFPMSDGYREGAAQDRVSLRVPREAVAGLPDFHIAEAVFEASNSPYQVTGLAAVVHSALAFEAAFGAEFRSLSVGDTVAVTVDGRTVRMAVERVGFTVL